MAKKTTKTTKSTTSAKASASGVATTTKPAKVTVTKVTATKAKETASTCCGGSDCSTPSYEQISQRAYEIWVAKGYPQGQDLENWKQAEAELMKGSLVAA